MRLAIGLLAFAAFAQDAVTTLDQVRDKVLAAAAKLPNYVCTETIDRSYYSRKSGADSPPSCEKIALDRRKWTLDDQEGSGSNSTAICCRSLQASVVAPEPTRRSLSDNGLEVAMQVSLEIPEDLGRRIVADPGELPRAALEGLALEAIRTGRLTVSQARRLLGIRSRYEMDGFLKAHGVFLDLTLEDVRRDSEVAGTLSG
jgi:hypothetical protein